MSQLQDKIEELKDAGVDSIESFVNYLLECDETDCLPGDIQALSVLIRQPFVPTRDAVIAKGVKIRLNVKMPEGRGFTSNNHDRWSQANGNIQGCHIGPTSRFMVSPYQPR